MPKNWKTLSSKEIFNHPRLTLVEDEVELPNGTTTAYLKYKDKGNGATIIAKNNSGKILLQKEYSYPSQKFLYQFPGGFVPLEEDIQKGANRELQEEAKVKSHSLKELGHYLINNRRSASIMHVFLATNLEESPLPSDLEEAIENFWFTEDEIESMMKSGQIINVHVLAAWNLYKLHNAELDKKH